MAPSGSTRGSAKGVATEYGTDAVLAHYLRVLRRGLWIVAVTTMLATLGAIYVSKQQEKLYRSSADVFLSNQNLATSLSNVQPAATEDPVRVAATQADLARTPAVAERALRLAHVTRRSTDELLGHSTVSSASNADILTFAVTDPNPRLAQRLAQSYATAYTSYRRTLDTTAITQALNKAEARLAELRRTGQQGSAAYSDLLDKEQQLATLQVLQGSNAQVVRVAGPAAQTQPRTFRNGVLAAILGMMLGVGLAFLRDAMNNRVRTGAEVQEQLALPLLGRVPEPPRRLRSRNQLAMLAEPNTPAAEPYRILATNLDFVNIERSARTVMLTSAQRGEGKSTTAANLAVALARAGRRAILVDLDFRAPSLAQFFFLEDRYGLTDVALGKVPLAQALVPIPLVEFGAGPARGSGNGAIEGVLEVLPVGTLPPNPAEFAGSERLAELLSELERRADIVVVDSAPLLNLSDAITLTARVDALIVVARLSLVRRPVLHELRRVLGAAPVAKLGVVLTGAEEEETYGYGHDYAYEYDRGEVAARNDRTKAR